MIPSQYVIAFILAAALPFCLGATLSQDIKEVHVLLKDTLKALRESLTWFNKEYRNVNLDGIIGTRIVEGQLKVLLRHIDYTTTLDGAIIQEIRDIQELAGQISNNALPYVQASDPQYYQKLNSLIQENFWTLDLASRDFTPKDLYSAWLPREGEAIHEEESDNCISEILGSGPNTNSRCHISTGCWKMMTDIGYSGYSLTHQIFYLQIAYTVGCSEQMDRQRNILGQAPPGDMVNQFCAAIYTEAKDIEKKGFPALRQDLFMEQAALCGIMGYRWFFSPEWLETILNWQDKETGCFKGKAILETQVDYRNDVRVNRRSRVKREERLLEHGCLCHRTTVAASALTMYVRYIVEYEQMMFEKNQVL